MSNMNIETLPVQLVTNPISPIGGTTMQLTITVNSAPSADTTVQIDCSDDTLLVSPSGSWPYQAPVPAGAATTAITLGTNSVSGATSVQIRGGGASEDMANPANWTATVGVTLATQPH
jgi:hypothetical protein